MSPLEKVFFFEKYVQHRCFQRGIKSGEWHFFKWTQQFKTASMGKNGKRTAPESPHRKANDNNSNMISELLG